MSPSRISPTPSRPVKHCVRCNTKLNFDSVRRGFLTCWPCSSKHDGSRFDAHHTGGCKEHGYQDYRPRPGQSGGKCQICDNERRKLERLEAKRASR